MARAANEKRMASSVFTSAEAEKLICAYASLAKIGIVPNAAADSSTRAIPLLLLAARTPFAPLLPEVCRLIYRTFLLFWDMSGPLIASKPQLTASLYSRERQLRGIIAKVSAGS